MDVLDLVISGFSVVGHHNFVDELCLDNLPPFIFVLVSMLLIEAIDNLQDCVASDNLLGGVHSQEIALLKVDEVGLVSIVHDEVVDRGLVFGVEVFSRSADFYVVQSAHDVSESVVEEGKEHFGVSTEIVHFHLFHCNRVLLVAFLVSVFLLCF